jgi:hypothetical protein
LSLLLLLLHLLQQRLQLVVHALHLVVMVVGCGCGTGMCMCGKGKQAKQVGKEKVEKSFRGFLYYDIINTARKTQLSLSVDPHFETTRLFLRGMRFILTAFSILCLVVVLMDLSPYCKGVCQLLRDHGPCSLEPCAHPLFIFHPIYSFFPRLSPLLPTLC